MSTLKAWRVWTLTGKGRNVTGFQRLESSLDPKRETSPTVWKPGPNKATCKFHDHFAPDYGCRCGFRGQPDYAELIGWLYDFKHIDAPVIGGVELSGAMLQGDSAHPEIPRIIRAEYATVIGPLVTWGWIADRWGDQLSRLYGCRVLASPSSGINQWYREINPGWFQFDGGLL